MAILLPFDTPVSSGVELPLKVHCGPVLAVAVAAPPEGAVSTSAAPPIPTVIIDAVSITLTKRMRNIVTPDPPEHYNARRPQVAILVLGVYPRFGRTNQFDAISLNPTYPADGVAPPGDSTEISSHRQIWTHHASVQTSSTTFQSCPGSRQSYLNGGLMQRHRENVSDWP